MAAAGAFPASKAVPADKQASAESSFVRVRAQFSQGDPAWDDEAPGLLAQLRYDLAIAPDDPAMLDLAEELRALSPGFRRGWDDPGGAVAQRGIRSLLDADGNLLGFDHETLVVDEHRHLRMVVYLSS